MATVAELEAGLISDRTKAALAAYQARWTYQPRAERSSRDRNGA